MVKETTCTSAHRFRCVATAAVRTTVGGCVMMERVVGRQKIEQQSVAAVAIAFIVISALACGLWACVAHALLVPPHFSER